MKITPVPREFDLSRAAIEWSVNGGPFQPVGSPDFDGTSANKGDTVRARASVNGQTVLSDSVQMMNEPPRLTRTKLQPEVFRPGDTLSVEAAAADGDGDTVSLLYAWTKNGNPAGTGAAIEGGLKRGDRISVQVTPFDGEAYGPSIVLEREVKNWPPVVVEHKDFSVNGQIYTYQVQAADADGDALTYALDPPQGDMQIDPATGLLTWKEISGAESVNRSVTVVVDDGHGGTARYRLEITMR
jgi:hypothetical protein